MCPTSRKAGRSCSTVSGTRDIGGKDCRGKSLKGTRMYGVALESLGNETTKLPGKCHGRRVRIPTGDFRHPAWIKGRIGIYTNCVSYSGFRVAQIVCWEKAIEIALGGAGSEIAGGDRAQLLPHGRTGETGTNVDSVINIGENGAPDMVDFVNEAIDCRVTSDEEHPSQPRRCTGLACANPSRHRAASRARLGRCAARRDQHRARGAGRPRREPEPYRRHSCPDRSWEGARSFVAMSM